MASKNTAETAETTVAPAAVYTKQRLLTLGKYRGRRDLLSVLLKEDKTYTLDQVDKLIENFMKGVK